MTDGPVAEAYRQAWPRLLGALVRTSGRVELAEDCLQEACLRALTVPDLRDPAAWIATTARRLMLDECRREEVRRRKAPLLAGTPSGETAGVASATGDDRLDLLVLACHPALSPAARMPLALRFVLGAPTDEIADAFLVAHPTMSARLTRAKRTLDTNRAALGPVPGDRVAEVLDVVSVLYTLGHTAPGGASLVRPDDCATAIELARAARAAWPDHPEAAALLALLLLTEARVAGRLDVAGRPTTLRDADRTTWDQAMIAEGLALATTALPSMGRLALQAGIAGLHSSASAWEATDWEAIVQLYDRLVERWPSPGARIARAVAVGHSAAGPEAGLLLLDAVDVADGAVGRQRAAARADLLRRAGRSHEAKAAYLEARALERNSVLQGYLDTQLAALPEPPAL